MVPPRVPLHTGEAKAGRLRGGEVGKPIGSVTSQMCQLRRRAVPRPFGSGRFIFYLLMFSYLENMDTLHEYFAASMQFLCMYIH